MGKRKSVKAVVLAAIFAVAGFTGCVSMRDNTARIFSEDNRYGFILSEPQHDINLKIDKPVTVKIAFNTEKVNKVHAYIATIIDGKIFGLNTAAGLQPPFETQLYAKQFSDGLHIVDYLLMAPGSMNTNNALAGVRLHVTVSGSINSDDVKNIDMCVQKLVKCIGLNDKTSFTELCFSKQDAADIDKTITDSSEKKALQAFSSNKTISRSQKNFEKYYTLLSDNKADISTIQFGTYSKKELESAFSTYKLIRAIVVFQTKKYNTLVECFFLVTANEAYLIEFNSMPQVLHR